MTFQVLWPVMAAILVAIQPPPTAKNPPKEEPTRIINVEHATATYGPRTRANVMPVQMKSHGKIVSLEAGNGKISVESLTPVEEVVPPPPPHCRP